MLFRLKQQEIQENISYIRYYSEYPKYQIFFLYAYKPTHTTIYFIKIMSKEKIQLIIKLLQEGRTTREICKIAHCSPNKLTPIRKKIDDENRKDYTNIKSKSLTSQAFDLFLKGVPLIQVIIDLDLAPELGKKYYTEFLQLQNKDTLVKILDKDKNYQDKLIRLHDYLATNNLDIKQVCNKVDLEKENKKLQAEIKSLELDNFNTKEARNFWETRYRDLKKITNTEDFEDQLLKSSNRLAGLKH